VHLKRLIASHWKMHIDLRAGPGLRPGVRTSGGTHPRRPGRPRSLLAPRSRDRGAQPGALRSGVKLSKPETFHWDSGGGLNRLLKISALKCVLELGVSYAIVGTAKPRKYPLAKANERSTSRARNAQAAASGLSDLVCVGGNRGPAEKPAKPSGLISPARWSKKPGGFSMPPHLVVAYRAPILWAIGTGKDLRRRGGQPHSAA